MISKENTPQITTIIPTYKRPKLLVRAIKSVLNQTYHNLQVHVFDNASGDETKETVLKISQEDSRVVYHEHDENIGAVNNFNSGLKMVKSPYFSLLSDDNVLLPNFYEDAILALKQNSEAIFFAGQTLRITNDYQKISGSLDKWKPGFINPPMGLIHLMEKGIPIWEGVLFRRKVIEQVGFLDPENQSACDQDYMMRISRHHPFFISKKPCALFFVHEESWSENRQLNVVLSTLKLRTTPWLHDTDLSPELRMRIKKVFNSRRNSSVQHFVFNQTIIGKNKEPLNTALKILKTENDLSYRVISLIKFAKYVSYNHLIHSAISAMIKNYVQLKKKFIFLKGFRNYKENKYLTVKS
ncbi:glycosyltransferase [candidate division KSB1 bacterium]|nr:glycosyltransferase [candidate division KSB1 bacterium]